LLALTDVYAAVLPFGPETSPYDSYPQQISRPSLRTAQVV
jgi:hypothetical protein